MTDIQTGKERPKMSPMRAGGRQVTAQAVAELAGVSRSAVSRTYTEGAYVSQKLRDKVLEAGRVLGYRVNYLARGVNRQRSELVGVVVADLGNPFRSEQVDNLCSVLLSKGLLPVLLLVDETRDSSQLVDLILHYMVSGIIITSDAPPDDLCQECVKLQVPLVMINKAMQDPPLDRVVSNSQQGGILAAEELLRAGCHELCVIKPEIKSYSIDMRVESFLSCCRARGEAAFVIEHGENTYSGGVTAACILWGGQRRPDGVFCAADHLALGFLDETRNVFGRAVPEDLRVVGHDDIPQAAWQAYDLTSIRQPLYQMAEQAVMLLCGRMGDLQRPAESKILDVELIRRATTK